MSSGVFGYMEDGSSNEMQEMGDGMYSRKHQEICWMEVTHATFSSGIWTKCRVIRLSGCLESVRLGWDLGIYAESAGFAV